MDWRTRIFLIFFSLLALPALGQGGVEVSLLTCAPGQESYSRYGHTALRVRDDSAHTDLVYNYGVFSFDKPHFVWRFILGETDYSVEAVPFKLFVPLYTQQGRFVEEQVLSLSDAEARAVRDAVAANVAEEGWTYRYNFLSDNCSTRPIKMVGEACGGLKLAPSRQHQTFRDIIHNHVGGSENWTSFGQDLILGADVDTMVSAEARLAFPLLAAEELADATVSDSLGHERPLVKATRTYPATAAALVEAATPWTPWVVAGLALLLALWLSVCDWRRGSLRWWSNAFDYVLLLVQGAAGCLVALLFFCSSHPAVGSNHLLVLLNPLPLLWLPLKTVRLGSRRRDWFLKCIEPILLLGYVLTIFLQKYPGPMHILALILLVRSLVHLTLRQNYEKSDT